MAIRYIMCGLLMLSACSSTTKKADGLKTIKPATIPQGEFFSSDIETAVGALVSAMGPVDVSKGNTAVIMGDTVELSFFRIALAGGTQATTEIGMTSTVEGYSNTGDANTLLAQWISTVRGLKDNHDYTAMVLRIFNGADDGTISLLKQLRTEGVHVETVDSDTTDETAREYFFGIDEHAAGQTGAKTLITAMQAKGHNSGTVIVLGEDSGDAHAWASGVERTTGAEDYLTAQGYTVAHVAQSFDPNTDKPNIKSAVTSAGSNLVGMLGPFAYGYFLVDALTEQNSTLVGTIPTVVFDSEPQTLAYLKSGGITATILQREYFMAYLATYVAFAGNYLTEAKIATILQNNLSGTLFETGIDAIDATALQRLQAFFNDLGVTL